MKLYAIRKDNMYLYLRYIDGDWDIPEAGDYYGAVKVEYVYDKYAGTSEKELYWNSNVTLDNLATTSKDRVAIFAAKCGGEVVTYNLVEE